MTRKRGSGRKQLLLLAAVFLGPLLIAIGLYFSGWQPEGSTEHGVLIRPSRLLPDSPATSLTGSPVELRGRWLLIYSDGGECGPVCRETLVKLRQVRRALGKDMNRVQMLFCMTSISPDQDYLGRELAGLAIAGPESPLTTSLVADLSPRSGEVLVADTLGNIMLRFPRETSMRAMHEDLKKLLKLSRIG